MAVIDYLQETPAQAGSSDQSYVDTINRLEGKIEDQKLTIEYLRREVSERLDIIEMYEKITGYQISKKSLL